MSEEKTTISREDLIKRCEKAVVAESKWWDRDSSDAQKQVGECWALLKAGCDYEIDDINDKTISLLISFKGFIYMEHGGNAPKETGYFYLPTDKQLKENKGEDWY